MSLFLNAQLSISIFYTGFCYITQRILFDINLLFVYSDVVSCIARVKIYLYTNKWFQVLLYSTKNSIWY